jgi:hypothetical protein
MEQAYKLRGNVLAEYGLSKGEGLDVGQNDLGSYDKPEEQTIP